MDTRPPNPQLPALRLPPRPFARLVLVFVAVIWLAVGVQGLRDPVGLMARVDIALPSVGALQEIRAMYGGLSLALGLLHLLAALRADALRVSLLASLTLTAGLSAGRLASLALDGVPSAFGLALLGTEIVGIALCGLAVRRLRG